jgi:1-acyl-sn-glycerol-3-phosphate acyltransferase
VRLSHIGRVARRSRASHHPPAVDASPQPQAAALPISRKVVDLFTARLADLERRVERELQRPAPAGAAGELAFDLLREWFRLGSRIGAQIGEPAGLRRLVASWTAAAPVDDLGFDVALGETVREIVRPVARRWLDLREDGSAPFPSSGGVLVLLNRSGWPLPVEALLVQTLLADGRLGDRRIAALWEREAPELPYWSDALRRLGIVEASSANAAALLERGCVVIAFPEGRAARTKTYDRRYRLARFEDAGLVAAAVDAGARIVPAAIVGNEESWPLLGAVAGIPVTAQFPALGLLGLLPLPLSWRVRLGSAIQAPADLGPEALVDAARARMQALLGDLLARRRSLFDA